MKCNVILQCTDCGASILPPADASAGSVPCPACGREQKVDFGSAFGTDGQVIRCAGCEGKDFYIQKDFSRGAGCVIFAATVVLSCAAAFLWGWIWWMGVLMATTLIDAVLYKLLPLVTVCYRCKATYRGAPLNPEHKPFEVYMAEKFDSDSAVMD